MRTRRVLLATLATFNLGMAATWALQSPGRNSSTALATLRAVGANLDPSRPMLAWALGYLLAGCCLLLAMAGSVPAGWAGLLTGLAVTAFYAGCQVVNAASTPTQPYSGVVVYGAMSALHGIAALNQRR